MQLSLLEQATNTPPEAQLNQVKLNFQAIVTWSQSVNSTLSLDFKDNAKVTETTTSLTYVDIPQFVSPFTPKTGLINYKIKLNLSTTVTSSIAILLDGKIIDEYKTSILPINTMFIDGYVGVSSGVQHIIKLQWKVDTAGTFTKYSDGNGKIQILSLVSA